MTIQTLRTTPKYKDFYTNFNVKAGASGRPKGDLYVLTDADAVKTSIKNLILTDPNERFFRPSLGGGIRRSLFENISPNTEAIIKTQIEYTIINYEPRAKLVEVFVNAVPDENKYAATIVFSVINSTAVEKLDLILYRVR
jgi:phage baseplate assembly protein W